MNSKTIETNSTINQTLPTANPPVIIYRGEQITELALSDKAKKYECVKTGYSNLTGAPVGETRKGLYISPSSSWNAFGNAGTVDGTNFIGTTDLSSLTFKVNNVFAGKLTPYDADGPISFGINALANNIYVPGNTQGNSAFGNYALYSNTSGLLNNAFGAGALYNNTVGNNNNAFGISALENNSTGVSNNAFGLNALIANTSGSFSRSIRPALPA